MTEQQPRPHAPLSRDEAIKKLRELIKDIKIAMLTTVDQDGSLRSRPMGTQEAEFDGTLWFFTNASAPKVDEIEREQKVNVSYADPGRHLYVSVSGGALLVRDRATMAQYWNPFLKTWFPDGLDTPGIALLRVTVQKAEYWEADSKAATLLEMAKALVSGETFEGGENQKLTL